MESKLADISGKFSDIIGFIFTKPTSEIIEKRKDIITRFSKFLDMIWANAAWDLWNRAYDKKLNITSTELGNLRSDMNILKDEIIDVYGYSEYSQFNKILEIFDYVSCHDASDTYSIWCYYPAEKRMVYDKASIMINQLCIDFKQRLVQETHSYRIFSGWFWRPWEFIKNKYRLCTVYFYYEPKRKKKIKNDEMIRVKTKIPGWYD